MNLFDKLILTSGRVLNYSLLSFSLLFFNTISQAQLSGRITDAQGQPLPYASVYVEGTTQGTSSNTEGYYFLELKKGQYRIVYQSIGFKKRIESINIEGKTVKNITLEPSDIELAEVVIKSNAEDPAYAIIRKAIEMRKQHRDEVPTYSCDVYIKGVQKIVDAPKKILGQNVGDMGGNIDTLTRSGIMYLSETVSKLYVDGNKKKEELFSSKVSGNDNGFGFNRATLFDFSFYDNTINLGRAILSPIADNALAYYKYRLEGTFKDDKGNTVNKIAVLPKRKEDPTWQGYIYIIDNQWNIYSTDLCITGKSVQQEILDTFCLRQIHVPVGASTWRLFSQVVDFKLKIFNLKIKGEFTGVYSNYNLTPQYDKRFFTNETFKVYKNKDDNSLEKWDTIRPIPLTLEEKKDYIKKDSLQKIRQTQTYIDSIEQKNNRFKLIHLLAGYTYTDAWNRQSFTVSSPLTTFQFNAIQGGNIALNMTYNKRYGERFQPFKKSLTVAPSVSYGFAEKKLRANARISYYFNRFNQAQISIEGGQKIAQFNPENPVTVNMTELQSLYYKRHVFKGYDKKYLQIGYGQEFFNGLTGYIKAEMAERTPLEVNTQYSFFKKDVAYNKNDPENIYNVQGINTSPFSNLYQLTMSMTWTPQQKYSTYPHYKEIEGSDYPRFSVIYRKSFKIGDNSVPFDAVRFKIQKDDIALGIAGYSELKTEYGQFLKSNTLPHFIDYNHFNGNETGFSVPLNFMDGFLNLPFYKYSNPNSYFMAHWQHHFEGFIFDKIPLIRKLSFKEVFRAAYLTTPDLKSYVELGLGIDNVGWGLFRILRFDVNWSYQNGRFDKKPNFMIGLKSP